MPLRLTIGIILLTLITIGNRDRYTSSQLAASRPRLKSSYIGIGAMSGLKGIVKINFYSLTLIPLIEII